MSQPIRLLAAVPVPVLINAIRCCCCQVLPLWYEHLYGAQNIRMN